MKKHKRAVKNCQEQKFGIETFRELAYNDIVSMAREASLQIITNIMRLEVEVLCGEIFSHKRGFCHRGGSEKGQSI
ncbi:MAG: hypothetical protein H7A23_10165 [Leptospiraceae bacterium]|nr:hypothetical protein [Leptospiraceae bacterium]